MNQSIYFGAGVLSNFDKYCEQKKLPVIMGRGIKRKSPRDDVSNKPPFYPLETADYVSVSADIPAERCVHDCF